MKEIENGREPAVARKEPVQARSRARFDRILDAAAELLLETGVDLISTKDIAAAADVSVASLYQYFPDKAAIIATLAERYNAVSRACVGACMAPVAASDDLPGALAGMMEGYFDFFSAVPAGRAIWEASQSDKRLQTLQKDEEASHARAIRDAFLRAAPYMDRKEALRLGRLFTNIIGSTVRSAATMRPKEGRAMIDFCTRTIIAPSVERAIENASRGKG